MPNYLPPDGYEYDANTGLYYTQIIACDDAGNQAQVVTWFNAVTGEYTQNTYPITQSYDEEYYDMGDGFAEGYAAGEFGQRITSMGKDAFGKAKGWIEKAGDDLVSAASGYDDDYDDMAEEDYYAYVAYDKNGNPQKPGFIRKILYAFKRFVNRCPLWMKFIPLAILLGIDIVIAIVKSDDTQDFRCSLFLGFIVIPFIIVHLSDLKRKYNAKALMIVQPVLLVVIGLLMMPSVIAVSFGIMKDTWLTPGLGPVFLWYLCVTIGYVLTYFMVRKRFQKIGLPMVELWTTVILVGMASMWVGVLAMWILALVLFVIMAVVVGPLMLKMALEDDKKVYRDEYGNFYDSYGNRL